MKIVNRLKKNITIRGLYSLWREYFGLKRKQFGYVGERVVMIPPLNIDNPANVYLYGLNKIEHCTIICIHRQICNEIRCRVSRRIVCTYR